MHVPSGDTRRGAGSTIRCATASRTKALPAAPPPVSPPHRLHVCVHPVAAGGEGSAGGAFAQSECCHDARDDWLHRSGRPVTN